MSATTNTNIIKTLAVIVTFSGSVEATGLPQPVQINETNICFNINQNSIVSQKTIINNFQYIDGELLKFIIEKPNETSINNANQVLDLLEARNIDIGNIVPSPDGGIMFEFDENNVYKLIEIFNNGEIVFVKDDNNEISSRDIVLENINNLILTEFNATANM